jgi:hypothetical protein
MHMVGKPEGKKPFRRSRHRRKDNIGVDLREVVWEDVDWIHLAKNRDQLWSPVNKVMKLKVP